MSADLERNKGNIKTFYDLMFSQCRPRETLERYAGDGYRQHNAHVASGEKASVEYLERATCDYPGEGVEFMRASAGGDYVILHCHQQWPGPDDYAGIDIPRLDEHSRIIEHWDVSQMIPEASANDNGVF